MNWMTPFLVCGTSALVPNSASALFSSNIETFDGTALDSTTWESFATAGATIMQNDRLVLTAPAGESADYTTRGLTVGTGEIVSVDVAILGSPNPNAGYTLALTNNSGGDTAGTLEDSRYIAFDYVPAESRMFLRFESSGITTGTAQPYAGAAPSRLEITREAEDAILFFAYDAQDTPVFGIGLTGITPSRIPEPLFVSLATTGSVSPIAFDNLTVTTIPEPSAIGVAFGGVGALMIRRRRR